MPTKRKTSRATQLPIPQSDYDTDTANLTDNKLLSAPIPAPPVRSITELNLIVLRKWYPDIVSIIAIAPYAVLYHLNAAAGEWEKAETEGSLFICELADDPYERYRVVILNRKSLENFTLELAGLDNIQYESGYIMAQVSEEDICGIWVFSDGGAEQNTAEAIWNVIETCARRAAHFRDLSKEQTPQLEHYADHAPFGLDGEVEQSYPQHTWQDPYLHHVQQDQSSGGQQIDLNALFSKPQQSQPQYSQPQATHQLMFNQDYYQPVQFANTADTDFFRSGPNAQGTQVRSQVAPQPEQSALLDLFRNAKRG